MRFVAFLLKKQTESKRADGIFEKKFVVCPYFFCKSHCFFSFRGL